MYLQKSDFKTIKLLSSKKVIYEIKYNGASYI